jgi:hypothetical protein
MIRYLRYLFIVISIAQIIFAMGFILQLRFFTGFWPLPYTNAMSYTFIASITLAAAAATLWCIVSDERHALSGIALDYMVIFAPLTVIFFQLASRSSNSALPTFAVVCVLMCLFGAGLFWWSRRLPVRDTRPAPRLVRGSFAFFVIALIIAGSQLVLRNPNIMPWSISADARMIYGWMFLGAAAYFAYGVIRPGWYNAGGQLAGFLAYDVVLIIPFLQRFSTIEPGLRINLIIYIGVLSYSGLLAIYYLFIHRQTRMVWIRKPIPAA